MHLTLMNIRRLVHKLKGGEYGMRTRVNLAGMLILVVLLMMTVCVSGREIVLTVHDVSAGEGDFAEVLREAASAFEKVNPNVRVEPADAGKWGDSYQKIPLLAAAGELPDILYIYQRGRVQFVRMGILQDITSYIEADPEVVDTLLPPVKQAMQYQGSYWGLPNDWAAWVAHVNRDAFEYAGLLQPDQLYHNGEWNFDTLPEIGQKLTVRDNENKLEQIGIFTNGDNEISYPWVWGMGGRVFSEDGTQVFLDQPAVRNGYQFFADLLNRYNVANIVDTPGGIGWDGFVKGRWGIALWWQLIYHLNRAWDLPYTFDMLPFPAGPVSPKTNLIGVNSWSIATSSDKKQVAWDFIKFMSSAEQDRVRISKMLQFPLHMDNIELVSQVYADKADARNLEMVFHELAVNGRPYTSLPDIEISTELTQQLMPVWLGERPLVEALQEAQRVVSKKLEEVLR